MSWLEDNGLVANPAKFQFMILGLKQKHNLCIDVDGNIIKASKYVRLLGVTIDQKLNFVSHIKELCKTTSQKTSALRRIFHQVSYANGKLLCNTLFESTSGYCPLIWLFSNKGSNNELNKVHKHGL